MSRGIASVVKRARALAAERNGRVTPKALRELTNLDLDATAATAACEALAWHAVVEVHRAGRGLTFTTVDCVVRVVAEAAGKCVHGLKPDIGGIAKEAELIVRSGRLVVSFHEDEDGHDKDCD
jgi:hypothetical protein